MGAWKKLAGVFVDFGDEEGEKVEDTGNNDEVSPEDIDKLFAELGVSKGDPSVAAATEPSTDAVAKLATLPGIEPDKPFSSVYSEQGVPPAAKSAEEVLAILNGMSTLPPEVRKISLEAMDNADDNWTMDDVKLDSRNKVAALSAYRQSLDAALAQSETNMNAALAEQDQYVTAATTQIRDNIADLQKQIAEMQTLLQNEIAESTQRKADIKSEHDSSVNAHAHECARVDSEIARLNNL